ncbi:MAG: hypothetical protein JRN15_11755 [Nitrososphaerota archaeon]|nr:hypothetical protein [Nitrososphaerota archaeon]
MPHGKIGIGDFSRSVVLLQKAGDEVRVEDVVLETNINGTFHVFFVIDLCQLEELEEMAMAVYPLLCPKLFEEEFLTGEVFPEQFAQSVKASV